MNRRHFIRTTATAAATFATIPMMAFNTQDFPSDILIGKGDPDLYGEGFSLQKEAYEAFVRMKHDAAKEGISIKVVSSYRSYTHQNNIWERKYNRFTQQGLNPAQAIEKIVEYSTIPGTSRHHWGTDIDIIDANGGENGDVLVAKKFHGNGPYCKLKEWMNTYAESFGFKLVYTDVANRKGFKYEPWHYSYAPISIPMLKAYTKLDLKSMLQKEKLMGSDHFTEEFISRYIAENILDINPALL
ncbi:M15 family metallopeptidase [Sungkyunkwania multivorans]|uniref:M15 family metallopeptidase n=1 Tax=Sungkyunkwania multivorans TaxID=1173618 RepID=A0ABW3D0M1_9FLAO